MRFTAFTRFTEGQREYEISFNSSRAYVFRLNDETIAQVYLNGCAIPTIIEGNTMRDVVRKAASIIRDAER